MSTMAKQQKREKERHKKYTEKRMLLAESNFAKAFMRD